MGVMIFQVKNRLNFSGLPNYIEIELPIGSTNTQYRLISDEYPKFCDRFYQRYSNNNLPNDMFTLNNQIDSLTLDQANFFTCPVRQLNFADFL